MEFEKLHHFLEEEESMRLKVLQQEAQVKSQVMSTKLETISQQIQNLSSTICDVETALAAKDLPFLQVCAINHRLEKFLNMDHNRTRVIVL